MLLLGYGPLGEQVKDDRERDQTDQPVITQRLDQGDQVTDDVPYKGELIADEDLRDYAESDKQQAQFDDLAQPPFYSVKCAHLSFL